ncbi:MAG: type III-B CRISPR module RAMP protein Cmr6 [Thermoanaerobaculia bacterium]
MSELPLPERLRELLLPASPGNRSLFFDKGMRYDASGKIGAREKGEFLRDFAGEFAKHGGEAYAAFLARRHEALRVEPIPFFTQARLVIGLGLPSPMETGFLFDRLTGCPYLPGSSVKGLLRATARLVQQGELAGDKDFWDENLDRIFGPEISPDSAPRTGEAIFYDAFPAGWPVLEVDVLTPHYGKYYREDVAPGDWDNPVPVAFLAVAAGTPFHFYIRAKEADFGQLKTLIATGLDWLGIGAKKSAGYGVFGKEAPAAPVKAQAAPSKPPRQPEPPPPPPLPPKPPLAWDNVELTLREGFVIARRGRQTASCRRDEVAKEILDALKKKREVRAEVEVLKISNSEYRLGLIKAWRASGR